MLILYLIILLIIFLFIKDQNNKNNLENMENTNNTKYKLSIMAIFKNEHEYMEEWLIHHIKNGISHFYLYCNDPDLKKYNFLEKYNHFITIIPWIDKKNKGSETIQRQAYTHCIQTFNKEYDFIMMLDLDEFLVHLDDNKTVMDFINSIDKEKTIALKVQRYNFGSNNHIKKPKGNVMDNYKSHEKICSSYKTIANINFVDKNKKFYGVHDFNFINNNKNKNENEKLKIYNDYFSYKYTGFPNGCKEDDINEIPLVINHYYTKSYNEFMDRCKLWKNGGVNNIGYRTNCENKFAQLDY